MTVQNILPITWMAVATAERFDERAGSMRPTLAETELESVAGTLQSKGGQEPHLGICHQMAEDEPGDTWPDLMLKANRIAKHVSVNS